MNYNSRGRSRVRYRGRPPRREHNNQPRPQNQYFAPQPYQQNYRWYNNQNDGYNNQSDGYYQGPPPNWFNMCPPYQLPFHQLPNARKLPPLLDSYPASPQTYHRSPSPLPGSEEHTNRKIQEQSATIKRQLNNDSDIGEIRAENFDVNSVELNDNIPCVTNKISSSSSAKGSACHRRRRSRSSSQHYDVKEIHEKIIQHISKLSHSKKVNLINTAGPSYDVAIHQIQRQKRMELSRALRDMCSSNEPAETNDVINSIIPDIGININDLPKEVIERLQSILEMDFEPCDYISPELKALLGNSSETDANNSHLFNLGATAPDAIPIPKQTVSNVFRVPPELTSGAGNIEEKASLLTSNTELNKPETVPLNSTENLFSPQYLEESGAGSQSNVYNFCNSDYIKFQCDNFAKDMAVLRNNQSQQDGANEHTVRFREKRKRKQLNKGGKSKKPILVWSPIKKPQTNQALELLGNNFSTSTPTKVDTTYAELCQGFEGNMKELPQIKPVPICDYVSHKIGNDYPASKKARIEENKEVNKKTVTEKSLLEMLGKPLEGESTSLTSRPKFDVDDRVRYQRSKSVEPEWKHETSRRRRARSQCPEQAPKSKPAHKGSNTQEKELNESHFQSKSDKSDFVAEVIRNSSVYEVEEEVLDFDEIDSDAVISPESQSKESNFKISVNSNKLGKVFDEIKEFMPSKEPAKKSPPKVENQPNNLKTKGGTKDQPKSKESDRKKLKEPVKKYKDKPEFFQRPLFDPEIILPKRVEPSNQKQVVKSQVAKPKESISKSKHSPAKRNKTDSGKLSVSQKKAEEVAGKPSPSHKTKIREDGECSSESASSLLMEKVTPKQSPSHKTKVKEDSVSSSTESTTDKVISKQSPSHKTRKEDIGHLLTEPATEKIARKQSPPTELTEKVSTKQSSSHKTKVKHDVGPLSTEPTTDKVSPSHKTKVIQDIGHSPTEPTTEKVITKQSPSHKTKGKEDSGHLTEPAAEKVTELAEKVSTKQSSSQKTKVKHDVGPLSTESTAEKVPPSHKTKVIQDIGHSPTEPAPEKVIKTKVKSDFGHLSVEPVKEKGPASQKTKVKQDFGHLSAELPTKKLSSHKTKGKQDIGHLPTELSTEKSSHKTKGKQDVGHLPAEPTTEKVLPSHKTKAQQDFGHLPDELATEKQSSSHKPKGKQDIGHLPVEPTTEKVLPSHKTKAQQDFGHLSAELTSEKQSSHKTKSKQDIGHLPVEPTTEKVLPSHKTKAQQDFGHLPAELGTEKQSSSHKTKVKQDIGQLPAEPMTEKIVTSHKTKAQQDFGHLPVEPTTEKVVPSHKTKVQQDYGHLPVELGTEKQSSSHKTKGKQDVGHLPTEPATEKSSSHKTKGKQDIGHLSTEPAAEKVSASQKTKVRQSFLVEPTTETATSKQPTSHKSKSKRNMGHSSTEPSLSVISSYMQTEPVDLKTIETQTNFESKSCEVQTDYDNAARREYRKRKARKVLQRNDTLHKIQELQKQIQVLLDRQQQLVDESDSETEPIFSPLKKARKSPKKARTLDTIEETDLSNSANSPHLPESQPPTQQTEAKNSEFNDANVKTEEESVSIHFLGETEMATRKDKRNRRCRTMVAVSKPGQPSSTRSTSRNSTTSNDASNDDFLSLRSLRSRSASLSSAIQGDDKLLANTPNLGVTDLSVSPVGNLEATPIVQKLSRRERKRRRGLVPSKAPSPIVPIVPIVSSFLSECVSLEENAAEFFNKRKREFSPLASMSKPVVETPAETSPAQDCSVVKKPKLETPDPVVRNFPVMKKIPDCSVSLIKYNLEQLDRLRENLKNYPPVEELSQEESLSASAADGDINDNIDKLEVKTDDSDENSLFNFKTFTNSIKSHEVNSWTRNKFGEVAFRGHVGAILVIKVINSTVVAASDSGNIFCFDLLNGDLLHTFNVTTVAITSMFITNKDGIIVINTGSLDGFLRLYNFETKELIQSIETVEPIQCMEFAWDYAFIGSDRGSLIRHSLKKNKFQDQVKISEFNVLVLKATQEGSRRVLLVATRNAPVSVRDAFTGLLLRIMEAPFSPTVYTLLFHKNFVFCGTSQHDILVYTFEDGQLIFKHEATKSRGVVCMQIVGNLLFAGCYNGNIYIYNIKNNSHLGTITGPGGMMLSMEITDNKIIMGTKSSNFKALEIPQCFLDKQ